MTGTAQATPLEQRYRTLLRVLPRGYRDRWAEDMVETFLQLNEFDDAEDTRFQAEYGRPGADEVRSVLGLALRLRLGLTGGIPRYLAVGSAVRVFALLGLLLQAANAGLIVLGELRAVTVTGSPRPFTWSTVLSFAPLLYVPVFLALLAGRRRVAGALGAVLALLLIGRAGSDLVLSGYLAAWTIGVLILQLAPIVAIGAFRAHTGVARPLRWGLALPAAMLVEFGEQLLAGAAPVPADAATFATTVLVGCAVAMLFAVRRGTGPDSAWPMAVAGVAGLVTLVQVLVMPTGGPGASEGFAVPYAVVWSVETAALLAVTVLAALLARRALRRLDAAPSPGPGWR